MVLSTVMAQSTFTESGGVIVFEAENYSNSVAGSGAAAGIQWVTTNSIPGYSGSGYVVALPNNGTTLSNANWLGVAPQLQYSVNFNTNLTHYVWVRAYAPAASNNLVNSGSAGPRDADVDEHRLGYCSAARSDWGMGMDVQSFD